MFFTSLFSLAHKRAAILAASYNYCRLTMMDHGQPGPSGVQKKSTDTPATSSEIAALPKQLMAFVQKLTSKAEENPPAKYDRFAEDVEDSDDNGQEATSKHDQLQTFMMSDNTKAYFPTTQTCGRRNKNYFPTTQTCGRRNKMP